MHPGHLALPNGTGTDRARRRRTRGRRRRAERAHRLGPPRPLRRHAVAQVGPRPTRTRCRSHEPHTGDGSTDRAEPPSRRRHPRHVGHRLHVPTAPDDAERVAIIDGVDGTVWTRGAVLDHVRRLAGGLHGRGISTGNTVALIAGNSPQFPIVFHAVALTGATVTPINPTYGADEIGHHSTTPVPTC